MGSGAADTTMAVAAGDLSREDALAAAEPADGFEGVVRLDGCHHATECAALKNWSSMRRSLPRLGSLRRRSRNAGCAHGSHLALMSRQ